MKVLMYKGDFNLLESQFHYYKNSEGDYFKFPIQQQKKYWKVYIYKSGEICLAQYARMNLEMLQRVFAPSVVGPRIKELIKKGLVKEAKI